MKQRLLISGALAWAALLGGCAAPTTYEGMVPSDLTAATRHPYSVSVLVTGGKETGAFEGSQVSDEAFKKALEDAITKSQVFSRVVEGKAGNYLISVLLLKPQQPIFGFSFTVKMEAGWTLRRADSGVVVWQESIQSEYTATTGDAFLGVTRLRLATEGAAKNNISAGLSRISQLKL